MISHFFISRPKFAFVISIVIVMAGLIALKMMPIAEFPDITPPQVIVTASYPGANAETIAKTVIAPLEQQINGVKNMIYMSSTSSNDGSASIKVSFDVGTNPDMNTVNVQNRVSQATSQLPEEVIRQGVTVKEQSSNILMILNIYSEDERYGDIYLSNFTSLNILDSVSRIHGVGDASILGSMDYAMRIWLDPNKMSGFGLSVQDVINAISQQNVQVAAGQIGAAPSSSKQQFQYTVQTLGRLSSVKEFKKIIVKAKEDGSQIRLSDVAKVELGATSYSAHGQLNGKPCANLAIYQLPEANALEVADAVKSEINRLSKNFPPGIKCKILYDTTNYVNVSIDEVVKTLFIAVILVVLVVYLFLQDWRTTLIPTIAIPVSLIGTFALLLTLGYSINTITLFALILAIGIVVDDAIVVVENVNRIIKEENLSPVEATKKSMDQVTGPIIATTLVLMAVFVPVAFIPGITGELYRQFAVTISVSVLISALNALTLSPALCATILKPIKKKPFIIFIWFNNMFSWITKKYNSVVSLAARKLKLVILFFILLLITSLFLYKSIPSGFLPNEDRGAFMLDIKLPQGASLQRTNRVMRKVVGILENTDGVANVMTVPGYSILSGASASNVGLGICVLEDWSKRLSPDLYLNAIVKKVNNELIKIPSADIFAFNIPPINGLGNTGGFEYILQSVINVNPSKLAEVMNDTVYKANQEIELNRVYSTFRADVPQLYLNIDRDKAEKMGVPLSEVFVTLQAYLGSLYVNQFNKFGKVYKVMIQAAEKYRDEVEDIYNLYVRNSKGKMVPLRTLSTVKTILGPDVINRYNMLTSVTINGDAASGYSSGDSITAMEKISKNLPSGYTFSWTGTAYQEILAGNVVIFIFTLALIFIYLFLVAQYESWMTALTVMLSVPVACFGALLAVKITGIVNNVYTQIGIVLLFGLATKTAILIVEFAKKQRENGVSIIESAEKAANLRFRAVVMTAIAFILGVFPLVIAIGAGAQGRRSIGTAVFGGMVMATVLGTVLVPVFFVIIQKISERGKSKK